MGERQGRSGGRRKQRANQNQQTGRGVAPVLPTRVRYRSTIRRVDAETIQTTALGQANANAEFQLRASTSKRNLKPVREGARRAAPAQISSSCAGSPLLGEAKGSEGREGEGERELTVTRLIMAAEWEVRRGERKRNRRRRGEREGGRCPVGNALTSGV